MDSSQLLDDDRREISREIHAAIGRLNEAEPFTKTVWPAGGGDWMFSRSQSCSRLRRAYSGSVFSRIASSLLLSCSAPSSHRFTLASPTPMYLANSRWLIPSRSRAAR